MSKTAKMSITVFTDPMMGLSYESEPFFRKLETHYRHEIGFRQVMSGLVRNVYDFVSPGDLVHGEEYAINRYLVKLARIYKSEEVITGMPINMHNLRLFSPSRTSSVPLNLAVKAAELCDVTSAPHFLYNLRFATVAECRPTTEFTELVRIAGESGINTTDFTRHYTDGSAQNALDEDFRLRGKWKISRLPAYLLQYEERSVLLEGVTDYHTFSHVIETLTDGEMIPAEPEMSTGYIAAFIAEHPLISWIELREAFGLASEKQVTEVIQPLIASGQISLVYVPGGWFIRWRRR
ncbi:DsbA family protein [Klebsiella pneumoniae]|uniref:DsbA family protein n=1 Tax=Klebsiella pneumoniae TaxID=573 RepID=UPI0007CCB558|nr:DsbA family protein [Klebsiella pneumoniae]SAV16675.1 Uncharacterised protein [Klebsiella pneumoniae]